MLAENSGEKACNFSTVAKVGGMEVDSPIPSSQCLRDAIVGGGTTHPLPSYMK